MFNTFCFILTRLHLSWLAAALRWTLARTFRHYITTREYGQPGGPDGYRGWCALPLLGTMAFVKPDGTRQYRW